MGQPLFCNTCLQLLIPIDPCERCPQCFTSEFNPESGKYCHPCTKEKPLISRIGAVFDYEGPAATLVKQMKYGGKFYLAKGAGAYLAMQYLNLKWPLPDLIVPMPISHIRHFERGFNQSYLLAKSLGKILNCPVLDILKRRSGDFSQAGLNHDQRILLAKESFQLKTNIPLFNQTVLLIDDVLTTGSSLRRCADALSEAYPENIFALTFCRAI